MFSLQHTEHDWNFRAEVTDKASKMIKNGSFWPRGKMLGGSSSMNAMIYLRGFPYDFDDWVAMGNEGWDYATVLEYFKKSENNQAQDMQKYEKNHSTKGPLKVDYFHSGDGTRFVFLGAAGEAGYQLLHDFNGDDRIGFSYVQGTVANGERQSTAKAYLSPVVARKNLHVIKHAHVVDLEVDQAGQVTGVNFNYNATKNFVAKAKKEVVLSAGAVNTPQILMLSGIGPKAQLEQHKIKVVKDLAVGQNLQDHVYVPLFFGFKKLKNMVDEKILSDQLFKYLTTRSGPFAYLNSLDLVGFVDSKSINGTKADIEYHHHAFERKSPTFLFFLRAIGYEDIVVQKLMEHNEKYHISVVWVVLANPKSTGEIVLRSNEPAEKPKIIPRYFEQAEDRETIIRGINLYAGFEESVSFKENEVQLVKINLPECPYTYKSHEYWQCYTRMMSTTMYHPTGTAKMGPDSDREAVVDTKLKVKGIKGLRVADASIMPKIVSVNTNAATIMIGERAADFIKEEWTNKSSHTEL